MNNLKVFCDEKFGEIRTVEIEDVVWFIGKDVAKALGYERGAKAVADHVDDVDKDVVPIQDSIGRMQNTPIINESGVYSLVFSSKLPSAKQFTRWVTSVVLPSIRKTGAYAPKRITPTSVGMMVNDIADVKEALLRANPAIPVGIAIVNACSEIEHKYGMDLPYVREALTTPDTTGDSECYMKPTEIATELNILYGTGRPNPQAVNKLLSDLGLQEKKGKAWRVTEQGREYGAEFPYERNGHNGYEIRWKRDVLSILREQI